MCICVVLVFNNINNNKTKRFTSLTNTKIKIDIQLQRKKLCFLFFYKNKKSIEMELNSDVLRVCARYAHEKRMFIRSTQDSGFKLVHCRFLNSLVRFKYFQFSLFDATAASINILANTFTEINSVSLSPCPSHLLSLLLLFLF